MTNPRQTPRLRGRAAAASLTATLSLVLAACGARSGPDAGRDASPRSGPPATSFVEWAGLRLELSVLPSPADRLRLRATVTNASERYRTAELPWCLIRARLYRDGTLAYDRSEAGSCGEGMRFVRLGSGEVEVLRVTLTAASVLGDSLPEGEYELRVRIPARDRPGRPRAAMELRLGTVPLQRPDTTGPDAARPPGRGARAGRRGLSPPRRPPPPRRGRDRASRPRATSRSP